MFLHHFLYRIKTPTSIKRPNRSCKAVKGSLRIINANMAPKSESNANMDPVLVEPISRMEK